jgi:hypothetical protein
MGMSTPQTRRPATTFATGQRYHHYVLIERFYGYVTSYGKSEVAWKCRCDCGKEFITPTRQITKGIRNSCGCFNKVQPVDDRSFIANARFNHYRNSAKHRNLIWDLSYDQFVSLLYSDCSYCGSPPNLNVTIQKHSQLVNGVDRADNTKGYHPENCVPCCRICNSAKSDKSEADLRIWFQRLISHNS